MSGFIAPPPRPFAPLIRFVVSVSDYTRNDGYVATRYTVRGVKADGTDSVVYSSEVEAFVLAYARGAFELAVAMGLNPPPVEIPL